MAFSLLCTNRNQEDTKLGRYQSSQETKMELKGLSSIFLCPFFRYLISYYQSQLLVI